MKKIKLQLLAVPNVRTALARAKELQAKLQAQYAELEQILYPEEYAKALTRVMNESSDPAVIAELSEKITAIKSGPGWSELTTATREAKTRANCILSKFFGEFRQSIVQLLTAGEDGLSPIRAEIVRAEKDWLAKWDLPWEPVVSRHVDQFAAALRDFRTGMQQDANQHSSCIVFPNAFATQLDWFKA